MMITVFIIAKYCRHAAGWHAGMIIEASGLLSTRPTGPASSTRRFCLWTRPHHRVMGLRRSSPGSRPRIQHSP